MPSNEINARCDRHFQKRSTVKERTTSISDGRADDLKLGLEREIKGIDRQIKEARRAATVAFALEEKLAGQKQIKVLESQRDAKRRSPLVFEEITGAAVVTFQVNVAGAAQRPAQVTGQVTAQVTGQVGTKSELESQLESAPSRGEVGRKSGLSRDQVKILRL